MPSVEPSAPPAPELVTPSPEEQAGWEEVYGPDYPLSAGDVPVLCNGLCRVRYNQEVGAPGFQIDVWDEPSASWEEQGRVAFARDDASPGGAGFTLVDTLVSAAVMEWTPDRAVIEAVMRSSTDAISRERVYLTLQRGWTGPRVEIYAAAGTDGTTSEVYDAIVFQTGAVDTNDLACCVDAAGANVVATAGTGSQLFAGGEVGDSSFTGENWVHLFREGQPYALTLGVVQAATGKQANETGIEGFVSNQVTVWNPGGYTSAHLGFCSTVADQTLVAPPIRNTGSGTTSQITDAAASSGQAVEDSQLAQTNPTLSKASTVLLKAKYRVLARVRAIANGAPASFSARLGSGSTGTAITSSSGYVWLDVGDVLATSAGAAFKLYAWGGHLPVPTGLAVVGESGGSLVDGTTYHWKVTALNANGETTGSAEVSLTGTIFSGESAALTWAAVPGATSYKVYRSTTSGGESTSPALVATVTTNSYTDTGTATTAGAVPSSNTATGGTPVVDRVQLVLVEDRVQPDATYAGARDLGQAALADVQPQTRRVSRG